MTLFVSVHSHIHGGGDLITDLPMVCEFKFVRCGHYKRKLVLYVPSEVQVFHFQNGKS